MLSYRASSDGQDPEDRLRAYLDRACAPLLGRVPEDRCREIRAEWEAHLRELFRRHVDEGMDTAAAVEAALTQFGDPAAMGRAWLAEWRRGPEGREPLRPAFFLSLFSFGVATLSLLLLPLLGQTQVSLSVLSAAAAWLFVGAPLTAGLVAGLFGRTRGAYGTFLAGACLALLASVGCLLHRIPGGLLDETGFALGLMAMLFAFVWLPVSVASAAAASSVRRLLTVRAARRVLG